MSESDDGFEKADARYKAALGFMYPAISAERNMTGAIELLEMAALAGHAGAQSSLARFLEDGVHVREDKQRALELYTAAAESGDTHSMLMLGYAYGAAGKFGVPPNLVTAAYWFLLAAEAGEKSAFIHVSECYAKGRGFPKNEEAAFCWKKRWADTGNVPACLEVAATAQKRGDYRLAYEMLFRASKHVSDDRHSVSDIHKRLLEIVPFLTTDEMSAVRDGVNEKL